ncbi:MAG: hypothetical protein EBR20_11485, partial [Bacteroidetes bacterium]|nr:hypothetical protein [Bacteroidota bacterium]
RLVVDPFRIWQSLEPRSLTDAYRRFVGGELENAIVERDAGYLRWIMKADFPMHVQNVCKGALSGMTEQDFNARILEHYGHPPEDAMTGQDD